MNRKKLATIGCIILSIVFSLALGLSILFKVLLPHVSGTYEKILYYPETLYKEYQKEAEGMIARHEYTCQYPTKLTFCSKNDRVTLVLKIGEFDEGYAHSNYITAIVKNFGTNEQEVTFERSRKSSEQAYADAERYRTLMNIYILVFIFILIIFTAYLIRSSIKRRYSRVLTPILFIISYIIIIIAMIHFLLA